MVEILIRDESARTGKMMWILKDCKLAGIFSILFTITTCAYSQTLFLFDSNISEGYYTSNEQKEGKFGHNAMLSPSIFYKLNSKNTLFSNYTVSYEETNQVIEEEGVRWTDQVLGNTLIFGWLHNPVGHIPGGESAPARFQNKLSLFGYYELTKGTRDEDLNTGLYNYWDIGLKEELCYLTEFKTKPLLITSGYKFYYRRFPNYEGLYYLIYETGPRWEKDYIGNRLWTGAELSYSNKLYLTAQITYLFKLYTDDLVQKEPTGDSDYPYTSDKRQEHVASVDLGCNYKLLDWLSINLGLTPEFRRGNQNYYDPDRLTFIPNVYDYDLYSISVDFILQPWQKLFCQAGYEFIYKQYTNNFAYDEVGNYTNEKLNKVDNIIKFNASYPVYKSISIIASGFLDISTSNTKYERVYGYNYQSSNFGLGINYKF